MEIVTRTTHEATVIERYGLAEPGLRELSRWLYDNPELAWQEHRSARRVADFLEESGFQVELPAFGLDTAFAARLGQGNSGPHIVLCAEYDALPEVGHACAHNLIAAISVGVGHALATLVDELDFRLTVLGTPAEECAGGKVPMLEAGAFAGADAVLMVHPAPVDLVDPRMPAVAVIDVEFLGHPSHAAQAPELGVNALDAYVQAYTAVAMMRQQTRGGARIHSIVRDGGSAVNVIPARTLSTWAIRESTAEELSKLRARVETCLRSAAEATGCQVNIVEAAHEYKELISDERLAQCFERAAARVGRTMSRTVPGAVYGSTDLGNVSHEVPSLHPFLALGDGAPNHDPAFADLTVTPNGHKVLRDGVISLAYTILDLLGDRDPTEVLPQSS